MALIKKLWGVIKEELFEGTEKKKTSAPYPEPGEDYVSYYSRIKKNTLPDKQVKDDTSVSRKEQNPQQKTDTRKVNQPPVKKHRKSKKAKTAKNMQNRMNRLPGSIEKAYKEAKSASKKGDYENALKSFEQVLILSLDHICKRDNIAPDGKNTKQLVLEIGEEAGATTKQQKNLNELCEAIARSGKFADVENKELMPEIIARMCLFLDIVYPKKKKKKKTAAGNNKSVNSSKKSSVNKLSFKAREHSVEAAPFNLDKEYPDVREHCNNAKKRFSEKNYKSALYEIRMTLESMINAMEKKFSITFDAREKLEDKIKKIESSGKLSSSQIAMLHKARISGNKGSHESKIVPGESDVATGMSEINAVIKIFTTVMSDRDNLKNEPVFGTNEYYSTQRKYHGRWAGCFSYGELMMIDDFAELKKKADAGDVQAMLDIASGFLESPISWTSNSLIYLRKYQNNPDPCDARYYYWILKACRTAYDDWKKGKPLPLRYLANALLEGIKFIWWHAVRYESANSSREIVVKSRDQFSEVKILFGSFEGDTPSNQKEYTEMLLAMMKEYEDKNLFAPVHRENTPQSIMLYKCWREGTQGDSSIVLNVKARRAQ